MGNFGRKLFLVFGCGYPPEEVGDVMSKCGREVIYYVKQLNSQKEKTKPSQRNLVIVEQKESMNFQDGYTFFYRNRLAG